jgi:hypothetical protein
LIIKTQTFDTRENIMNSKAIIRVLVLGDSHCGDKAGLTPISRIAKKSPYSDAQTQLWNWFEHQIKENSPYDYTMLTGDMVEGTNNKNTIELYESDTDEQGEIAAECCRIIPCEKKNFYCVYGTPFHTAGTYSYENNFAQCFGIAKPKTTQLINFGDMVRVNVRHTVGRSSIPYGQGTPTYKEMVNEIINAALQEDDSADICIRGHAHYSVSMRVRDHESIVVPCLKYPGSVFGRKLPETQYDMGFGILEIYGYKNWRYIPVHMPLEISGKRDWTNINVGRKG